MSLLSDALARSLEAPARSDQAGCSLPQLGQACLCLTHTPRTTRKGPGPLQRYKGDSYYRYPTSRVSLRDTRPPLRWRL
jgi:hypothetical protein